MAAFQALSLAMRYRHFSWWLQVKHVQLQRRSHMAGVLVEMVAHSPMLDTHLVTCMGGTTHEELGLGKLTAQEARLVAVRHLRRAMADQSEQGRTTHSRQAEARLETVRYHRGTMADKPIQGRMLHHRRCPLRGRGRTPQIGDSLRWRKPICSPTQRS